MWNGFSTAMAGEACNTRAEKRQGRSAVRAANLADMMQTSSWFTSLEGPVARNHPVGPEKNLAAASACHRFGGATGDGRVQKIDGLVIESVRELSRSIDLSIGMLAIRAPLIASTNLTIGEPPIED